MGDIKDDDDDLIIKPENQVHEKNDKSKHDKKESSKDKKSVSIFTIYWKKIYFSIN